jgi:hypothetical protein
MLVMPHVLTGTPAHLRHTCERSGRHRSDKEADPRGPLSPSVWVLSWHEVSHAWPYGTSRPISGVSMRRQGNALPRRSTLREDRLTCTCQRKHDLLHACRRCVKNKYARDDQLAYIGEDWVPSGSCLICIQEKLEQLEDELDYWKYRQVTSIHPDRWMAALEASNEKQEKEAVEHTDNPLPRCVEPLPSDGTPDGGSNETVGSGGISLRRLFDTRPQEPRH